MSSEIDVKYDDRKFNKVFGRLLAWTSRDIVTEVNTTAYYIARKAVWFTQKASKEQVKSALVRITPVIVRTKKGGIMARNKRSLVSAREIDAPLAAVIINARRGRAGLPGLHGSKMRDAVRSLIAARAKSIAYIKSGWLASIRALAQLAAGKGGLPPMDSNANQVGKVKGYATPAKEGSWTPAAKIVNEAYARRDPKDAFAKVGGRGLQMAIDDETASKERYIEKKMKERAEEFNRSQN